jgi:serine/threonine-protein kinase RsbW
MKQTAKFPGDYAEIRNIGRFIASGCDVAGLDDDARFQVELACDEACTNIIEHAYGGEGLGVITVSWEVTDGAFVITLEDDGPSFQPESSYGNAPMLTPADDVKIGGLGVYFIRNLMDEVHYIAPENGGNELVLVKWLPIPETHPIKRKKLGADLYLVTVAGRIDHQINAELERHLTRLLDNHHYRLIVDLSATTYINSSGLRILVSAWRQTRQHDGDLHLSGLNDNIMNIFTMVGFDKLFDIFETAEQAQDAFETA